MDEDQEMERFGMKTKDDVIYGIFADNDSNSEGVSCKNKRRKQDLTKPLNFVSKGVVMPSQEIDQDSKDKSAEDGSMTGVGLGASSLTRSGFGVGFGSNNMNTDEEEVNDTSVDFPPTAFGKQFKERVLQRREQMEKSKLNEKSSQARSRSRETVGIFEKHTKGIGSKILEIWGYKGGGLGKNAQGIVTPVEAKSRPKNMGIGYKYNEYKQTVNLPMLQELLDQNKKSQTREKMRSKKVRSKMKKKDYVTADVVQKVFDMRGPQVRVLTNLENLNAAEKSWEDNVPMPELLHNVRLVLDLAELDIRKLDQDLRNERERIVTLQKEVERLKNDADRQKKQLDCIGEIVTVVEQLDHDSQTGTLTLESVAKSFRNLKTRFPDEYNLGSLSAVACSFALPLFFRELQGWNPLKNPENQLTVVSVWKDLLQRDELFDPVSWEQMMVRFVVPKLLAVMHEFQVNPSVDQKVDQFHWVLTWVSVIPVHHMLHIMDVFFNKWQEVLYKWLCSKPDFKKVTDWFLGWRDRIPAELSSNEHIRAQLYAGLDMMNQAAEGLDVVKPVVSRENISYLKAAERRQLQTDGMGSDADMSLKEVVEFHSQQNDLLFKPKPGRMLDGYQVYGFGNINIIIDSHNQKVFAQVEDQWSLVSFEQLVKLEKNSVTKSC